MAKGRPLQSFLRKKGAGGAHLGSCSADFQSAVSPTSSRQAPGIGKVCGLEIRPRTNSSNEVGAVIGFVAFLLLTCVCGAQFIPPTAVSCGLASSSFSWFAGVVQPLYPVYVRFLT
jgi:hypothetical protein